MDYIRSVEDFKRFLAANRDEILAQTISLEDDEWDEIKE